MTLNPDPERIRRDIHTLSEIIDPDEEGFTRLSFSEEYDRATALVSGLMEREAGMIVKRDAIGNLIGKREGIKKEAPALMIGSHLDTVRQGGKYDGIIGVLAGLETARCLHEEDLHLHHPLEVVAFLAEEPSPYGMSTIGSKGMAGHLTVEALQKAKNSQGENLYQAIRKAGGNPDHVADVRRTPDSLAAYLELHIEQGPILDHKHLPLGLVTGIVSIYRGKITITGISNHAGTTPMSMRRDALQAAAEAAISFDKTCRRYEQMVGTVGEFNNYPNASNVIPGRVTMGVEMRSPVTEDIETGLEEIRGELNRIEDKKGVAIETDFWLSSPGVTFPESILEMSRQTCRDYDYPYLEMPSGAGHDSSYLSEITPTGMIFVPSRNGLSHCPEEFTDLPDIMRGIEVIAAMILKLDTNPPRR